MRKFIDHTADVMLYVEGKDFAEAVGELVNGMLELMEKKSEEKESMVVEYEEKELEDFVVGLLERIIVECETQPFHPRKAEVLEVKEKPYYAKILLKGERKYPPNPIKAVTYHQLIAKKKGGKYVFQVLLDI